MRKMLILAALHTLMFSPGLAYSAVESSPGGSASAGALALTTVVENVEQEKLLADTFSRTLYTFDLDNGSTSSKCEGGCAEIWPPVLVQQSEAAQMIAPLGTVVRSNKSLQLTFEGKPVYTYAFDRKVGDDQGDGVGGVWHYIELE